MTEINRYNKGKIYKLVSNQTDKIYVGSTCKDRLCQRLAQHKKCYNHWLKDNNNGYTASYELFKLGDVEIILLESINCNTKDELLKKEREYIEKHKEILVNKRFKPIITKEEEKERNKKYYEDNNEKIKEVHKQYYEKNKEILNKQYKQYREEHKEERKQYDKEYRNKNKEKLQKQDKEYYENNKEKINEMNKKICNCECGMKYTFSNKARHEKSLKHQKYINSLNQPILET